MMRFGGMVAGGWIGVLSLLAATGGGIGTLSLAAEPPALPASGQSNGIVLHLRARIAADVVAAAPEAAAIGDGSTKAEERRSIGNGSAAPQPELSLAEAASRLVSPAAKVVFETVEWNPKETAVIVCDMWDDHWCSSAAARVAEMAPRMNQFLDALRRRGVLVVHAPSGTMEHYKDWPQRRRALEAPAAVFDPPARGWCKLDPQREAPLPIDDRAGGCDTPGLEQRRAWKKQIDALEIAAEDAIGDGVDVLNLLAQRGIRNVMLVGVHTNMCVLGRPFGIRQLVYQGKRVVLVRDLTDAMYDPAAEPKISHFGGTARVVAHIERYWCPTIESNGILGGAPFRFRGDRRPRVVFLINEDEYRAEETLARWAADLEFRRDFSTTVIQGRGAFRLDGIDALRQADAAVLYIRRRPIPAEQLDVLRRYLAAGRPLLALRTTSHAFAVRAGAAVPEGVESWPDFDREVLGCEYRNHAGNALGSDIFPAAEVDEPLLHGVEPLRWHSRGSLYLSKLLDPDARVLLKGKAGELIEPVAWTRTYGKSRVFYTSLGHADDFERPQFQQLLNNALCWLLQIEGFAPQPTPATLPGG